LNGRGLYETISVNTSKYFFFKFKFVEFVYLFLPVRLDELLGLKMKRLLTYRLLLLLHLLSSGRFVSMKVQNYDTYVRCIFVVVGVLLFKAEIISVLNQPY